MFTFFLLNILISLKNLWFFGNVFYQNIFKYMYIYVQHLTVIPRLVFGKYPQESDEAEW